MTLDALTHEATMRPQAQQAGAAKPKECGFLDLGWIWLKDLAPEGDGERRADH
jgi:hypothetical protein